MQEVESLVVDKPVLSNDLLAIELSELFCLVLLRPEVGVEVWGGLHPIPGVLKYKEFVSVG